jgi:tRNA(Ile2) C34 agmatinyltransferase TiaS
MICGIYYNTGGRIAVASIEDASSVRSFLDAVTAVETSVHVDAVFLSTDDKFDSTLETRVASGARTIHASHVFLILKGEGIIIFHQACEGTKEFALAVLAFSLIVTKEIASPVVGHCCRGGQQGE